MTLWSVVVTQRTRARPSELCASGLDGACRGLAVLLSTAMRRRVPRGRRGRSPPRRASHLLSLVPVVSMRAARPASSRAAGIRNGEQET
jgi:hypothetical protein